MESYLVTLLVSIVLSLPLIYFLRPDTALSLVIPTNPGRSTDGRTCLEIVNTCTSLLVGFRPAWWLPIGHLQTIYSALANFDEDDPVVYERKLLRLPDGGTM
jgi:hypothetical protein